LLRHSPPHKAIIGGQDDIAAMSLDETLKFAGIDPAVNLCRADAAFPRELADRLSERVLEFPHRVALGIERVCP
jgi:hypothetical protein